ncbi:MAG: hypothetical protein MPJ24_00955 [Pirellulaceae bacterium]|nr:hypothetical protein [Pirellulaceae bacterium]
MTMTLLTCLVGLGVTIMMAGIPWAYSIHGRLTKIETNIVDSLECRERIDELGERVLRIEIKLDSNNDHSQS